jgi:hypothetical protein
MGWLGGGVIRTEEWVDVESLVAAAAGVGWRWRERKCGVDCR